MIIALYLFGPPKLELDDATVHIPRRKATALLAYLAISGQRHSRDALATLLWPENDQSSARAELRRTLSVLNRVLGEGWLQVDRETVSLIPDPGNELWLDVADFQEKLKVSECHHHLANMACPECLPALEKAVELYQDDFMAGFSLKDCREYEEWQFFKQEELRTKLTNALMRLSSYHAALNDHETAILYARRWLALDPLQEAAHRKLMSLLWQSGQRSAALRQYEKCQKVLSSELGVEPSEETLELYQKIKTSTLVTAAALRPKSNLPTQTTPFIGRESELAEIRAILKQDECRLLTLLGPGGSGKTRLAIEAAGGLLDEYKHGVFFVNLAPLDDPARLPTTIAAAISFSFFEEGTPEEQLLDYLGNKELLLILDNFEHILAGVNLVNKILNEAPGVKILATSRTRLMVTGEHLFDVWGMAYPQSPVSLKIASQQYSAVKLFESQASQVQGNFQLDDENLIDVIRICDLLEGMPLGIVLGASWMTMLTPKDISDEIIRDLAFLEKELRDLPERQRGMRSVFNHSWRLLSEREQEILSALSVFRSGFTRVAAQAVSNASLRDLTGLIDKSMLHRVAGGRFEIHELVRQFTAEKLGCDPATEQDIRSKHSDYFCRALAVWERELQGPQQAKALQEITVEIENIWIAWNYAVEGTRTNLLYYAINGLCLFYYQNYQRSEGDMICHSLIENLENEYPTGQIKQHLINIDNKDRVNGVKLQARALAWRIIFNHILGNIEINRQLYQNSLSLLTTADLIKQDTRFEKAVSLVGFSGIRGYENQDEGKQLIEEAVDTFIAIDEPWWQGFALELLGDFTKSFVESTKYYEDSIKFRKRIGDLRGIARSLLGLAGIAANQCQFTDAERLTRESLDFFEKLSDRNQIVSTIGLLGTFMVWQGRFIEARTLEYETLKYANNLNLSQSHASWLHSIAGYPDQYLGEYEAALSQAQYALAILREVKHFVAHYYGTALSIDILARVALAKGSYLEAEGWLKENLHYYRKYDILENIGQDLACLGFTSRGLNQSSQAQGYLTEALQVAVEAKRYLSLIQTLPGIALLFADQGDAERAVELYALASTQGIVANSKWFDDIAGDEIAQAAERLPVEVVEAAKERGRSLDLWGTAQNLLEELEEAGWGCES